MEMHAIDTLSGREEVMEIDPDATVHAVKRRCGEAFDFGEDVELSVDGQRVACDATERISDVAAFSAGCRVGVVRGVAQFVAQLRRGSVKMDDLPAWARQRRECALGMLASVSGSGMFALRPHWVHPSLHGDKEVMMHFVSWDPNAFVRASASLRSDPDLVLAALERDASLWRHVADKSLQDDRDVALLAVPYCANSAVWLSDKAFVLEALQHNVTWSDICVALQQDKEVVMKALSKRHLDFGQLSEALRGDKEVVMKALRCAQLDEFKHIARSLQQDKEVVMMALSRCLVDFGQLTESLRGDKEVVIEALRAFLHTDRGVAKAPHHGMKFGHLRESLQQDKEVVMMALSRRIVEFDQLSEPLRGDKEVVMKALHCEAPVEFQHITQPLQQDKEIVMTALTYVAIKFRHLSEVLQQDKDVVIKALRKRVVKFRDLSESLQQDKVLVMKALARRAVEFRDLSETLRGDKEVVMKVIDCDMLDGFQQISDTLQQDKGVVMKALSRRAVEFHDLNEALQGDREVVMKALDCKVLNRFQHLCRSLQQDKEVVMHAISKGVVSLRDLSDEMQADKDVVILMARVLTACTGRPDYRGMAETLRADKSFMLQLLAVDHTAYGDISDTLREDKDIALFAVARMASWFVSMSPELRDDPDVALAAIRADPCNFVYAGGSVRGDKHAALAAFRRRDAFSVGFGDDPVLLPFASAELQADQDVVAAAVRANPENAPYASPALQDLIPQLLQPQPPPLRWQEC